MEHFMTHIVSIIILVFLLITFLQSGIDKAMDWQGNVGWLKEHFSTTFLGKIVPLLLSILLIIENITAVLCVMGIYRLIAGGHTDFAIWAMLLSCITLLFLLFGQRIAKDYAGALTITCYFMVAVFGLYVVTQ